MTDSPDATAGADFAAFLERIETEIDGITPEQDAASLQRILRDSGLRYDDSGRLIRDTRTSDPGGPPVKISDYDGAIYLCVGCGQPAAATIEAERAGFFGEHFDEQHDGVHCQLYPYAGDALPVTIPDDVQARIRTSFHGGDPIGDDDREITWTAWIAEQVDPGNHERVREMREG